MGEIFGRRNVLEALKSGAPVNRVTVVKGGEKRVFAEIKAEAFRRGIPVVETGRKFFEEKFPGENHQGVCASRAAAAYLEDWREILETAAAKGEEPFILVLDGIEDPHNLGAMIRTCEAAGVHGVIIPKRRAVPLTEGVAKASAGAVEYVPVARVANIAGVLDELKKAGCWIVGTAMKGRDVYEEDLPGAVAVVVGNEQKGISPLVEKKCDFLVSIPMSGKLNSLNASVAAGIVIYEIKRKKKA